MASCANLGSAALLLLPALPEGRGGLGGELGEALLDPLSQHRVGLHWGVDMGAGAALQLRDVRQLWPAAADLADGEVPGDPDRQADPNLGPPSLLESIIGAARRPRIWGRQFVGFWPEITKLLAN